MKELCVKRVSNWLVCLLRYIRTVVFRLFMSHITYSILHLVISIPRHISHIVLRYPHPTTHPAVHALCHMSISHIIPSVGIFNKTFRCVIYSAMFTVSPSFCKSSFALWSVACNTGIEATASSVMCVRPSSPVKAYCFISHL